MSGRLLDGYKIRADMAALIAFARNEPESKFPSRSVYFVSLNLVQQHRLRECNPDDGPSLDFVIDDPETSPLIDILRQSSELKDPGMLSPVPPDDVAAVAEAFQAGRALLKDYDPEVAQIVDDLVAWVICFSKEGYDCGSMWHMLGAIWMSPGKSWTRLDYAENLLHEAVHQAMLLSDMVHSLFAVPSDELAQEDALVISSIRQIKRPYDFAFHAATVAVCLIDFHERVGSSERANELVEPLVRSLAELVEKQHLLSSYGIKILTDMIHCANGLGALAAQADAAHETPAALLQGEMSP